MKTFFVVLVFLLASIRLSASEVLKPQVRASGTAVLEIKPDLLRWRLTIKNVGADVATVAEEHAELTATTLQFLRDAGIEATDLQAAWMQLAEHREYRNNSWVREGYVASTAVSFTVKNISRHRDLWLGLAKIKGVEIDGVTWDSSKRIETQRQARLNALQAAKTKATEMAQALGAVIVEPLAIEDITDVNDRRSGQYQMNSLVSDSGAAEDATGGTAPGVIPVRVRVEVTFRVTSTGK